MNSHATVESWDNLLFKCMSDLKEQHPRYNDGQIADSLRIPRATFNRIKNHNSIPRLDNLIKIIIGSGNQGLLTNALSIFNDDLAHVLQKTLQVAMKEDNKIFTDKQLEALLDDRDVFVAYLLASMPNGTSSEQLINTLGKDGLEAMTTLIKKGFVIEVKGHYSLTRPTTLIRSFDSVKHHITTYAKFYRPAHVGQGRNYVHSLSDGLNKTGIAKVQDAHRRFHEELQRIYRDENYTGDIPSFSVAFCDTFTSAEIENSPLVKEVQ